MIDVDYAVWMGCTSSVLSANAGWQPVDAGHSTVRQRPVDDAPIPRREDDPDGPDRAHIVLGGKARSDPRRGVRSHPDLAESGGWHSSIIATRAAGD